ncbi:MAG: archease [Candidatus Ratteibacteria bacterium]|nr:archease [Candidatus Ratteibacteria bacterium]
MARYEIIPHTADIGLRVFGRDLKELFSTAARGMLSLVLDDLNDFTPREETRIKVSGLSVEELLVSWLGELLYKLTEERWLGIEFDISSLGERENKFFLTAAVKGQKIEYNKTPLKREIKAVTYHNLTIKKNNGGICSVEIIFDV